MKIHSSIDDRNCQGNQEAVIPDTMRNTGQESRTPELGKKSISSSITDKQAWLLLANNGFADIVN